MLLMVEKGWNLKRMEKGSFWKLKNAPLPQHLDNCKRIKADLEYKSAQKTGNPHLTPKLLIKVLKTQLSITPMRTGIFYPFS